MPKPEPKGTVRPTSPQMVATSALLGGGIGWLLFAVSESFGWPLPQLPLVVAVVIAVIAALIAVQARTTHRRIQVRAERLDPDRALALLVLGKATFIAGAGMVGGYVAVALYFVQRMAAELPRERVISSLVAIVASLGLAVAGAFLERACRIPGPPGGDATPKDVPRSESLPD